MGRVDGCLVIEGRVTAGSRARCIRDHILVHQGAVASLKRVQSDVREVLAGQECGIGLGSFSDVKVGDVIQVYQVERMPRRLADGEPEETARQHG